MARTGFGLSNFLRSAAPPVTAFPFSMSLWFKITAGAANLALATLCNSASNGILNMFLLQATSATRVLTFTAADASANSVATTSTTWSDGVWAHALVVAASATDRSIYLNGGGKGTNAVSRVPAGINRFSLAQRDNVSAAKGELASGDMLAEAALYSVALTDADAVSLAVGVPAFLVRLDKLVHYSPLIGLRSPETNLCSNTDTLAVQGTLSAGAHPRILF